MIRNQGVACEVLATKGMILAAGEITSTHEPYVFGIMKKILSDVGYHADNIEMDALIHQQSPDIAKAVECSREKRCGLPPNQPGWENGAGDQGVMIGYACDETPQFLPMPVVLANRIVRELAASRRSHFIEGILPDGKAQVTVEYEDGRPVRLDSVVVSCQHTKDKNLKKLEQEIRNKVLTPALRLLPADEDTAVYINPSGRFVCGGLDADTGLTGRKLMVDTSRKYCSAWRRGFLWKRLFESRPLRCVYGQVYCEEHGSCRPCQPMPGVPRLRYRCGTACHGAGGYFWNGKNLCG